MSRSRWSEVGRSPLALLLLGWALVSLVSGCGGGEPFSYKKIKGKVTYDDGTLIPAAVIRVKFLPENMDKPLDDKKTYPKAGTTDLNVADGTFDVVTTHTYGDGVIPGKLIVQILAYDAQDRPLTTVIPPEYGDPTKKLLVIDTATGDDFQLKVKKPVAGAAPGK